MSELRKLRQSASISQARLAEMTGTSQPQIKRLELGERKLTRKWAERLAPHLGVAAERLMFGSGGPMRDAAVASIRVIGEVAAGVWREADGEGYEPYETVLPVDPRWPPESVYALVVRGHSINRRAADGAMVVCLDVYAAPRAPQHGDWVVARRMRNGFCEMTVKRLHIRPDGAQCLYPDSTDERFQEPIEVGMHDGDEVSIAAFVLDSVNVGTRF
jgi:SOS-response transcriptional repressor LexA